VPSYASFFKPSGAISALHFQHIYALTVSTLQYVSYENAWLKTQGAEVFYVICIPIVEHCNSIIRRTFHHNLRYNIILLNILLVFLQFQTFISLNMD
jgi:hypothetical protein